MIGTLEGLLGMPPMSITDPRVTPMWRSFGRRAVPRPYDAITPSVRPFDGTNCAAGSACGYDVNPASAPMAKASSGWSFRAEDTAPEVGLNRAIWQSVKGRRSSMPAPRHTLLGSRPTDQGGH